MEIIKKYLKWIILFVCLIGFIAIAEDVFENEIMKCDIIGYGIISKYLISDKITPIAKAITNFGGIIALPVCTICALVFIKDKKIALYIALNLVLVTGLNIVLKNIVQRPRPLEYRIIDETGYSFPSGHSMVSAAYYGFIIYLIYKMVENKKIKWTLITILSLLVISIGISRIYLGVHYTSDVIAGFLISISFLVIYTSIVSKILFSKNKNIL